MGVAQLLRELRPCLVDTHVEKYRGKTVAIDGNAFIFKGSYSCSEQVATGQACSGPVEYVLKRIRMLRHYGVTPWVVLDGRRTPMKEETNSARRAERERNLRMALDLRRQASAGPRADKEALLRKAETFFQKSIHVTRQMITNTVEALRQEGVECLVAPYEADAQVAYLVKCGLASAVITEDSDVLVYLAAVKSTAPVLYKMDNFGACQELAFDPPTLSTLPGKIGKLGRGLSAFGGEGGGRLFVQLATLAGCDYVDNIKGLGLLTALPLITKFKCIEADRRMKQILTHLRQKGKTIPDGHGERILQAELSFFWHRVYDPRSRACVHFCSAAPGLLGTGEVPALSLWEGGEGFLGEHIEQEQMVEVALGMLDPVTCAPVSADSLPRTSNGGRCSSSRPIPGRVRPLPSPLPSFRAPLENPEAKRGQALPDSGRSLPPTQKRRAAEMSRGLPKLRKEGPSLLRDMFRRAAQRSAARGEARLDRDEDVGDVSEIVLACEGVEHASATNEAEAEGGQGMTSAAGAPPTEGGIPNPFKKRGLDDAEVGRSRQQRQQQQQLPTVSRETGGTDAWSRLRHSSDPSGSSGRVTPCSSPHPPQGPPRFKTGVVESLASATSPRLTGVAGGCRAARGAAGARRGKERSAGRGSGATILSYFGQAAASKS